MRADLLLRAGLLTAVVDGCFATVLHLFVFESSFARLWQGVASVLIGPRAFEGGRLTVALGLVLHVVTAFTWSAVFLFVVLRSERVRRRLTSMRGIVAVAAVYGPFVWLVMSIVVIPLLVGRPPRINDRFWIQLVGHVPFVGIPIVASSARLYSKP